MGSISPIGHVRVYQKFLICGYNYNFLFKLSCFKVGYGDVVPLSTLGKCFAGMTVILGIGLLAIPIGIIGSNFSVIYFAEEKKEKFIKKIEKSLKQERKIDKF